MGNVFKKVQMVDGEQHFSCSMCKNLLPRSSYYSHKSTFWGIRYACKKCEKSTLDTSIENERARKHHQDKPWTRHYALAKNRCRPNSAYGKKGRKFLITMEEIMTLWFRDKAYLLKRPSIHRINNDGNYEVNNCCFIEVSLNASLRHKKNKIIVEVDNG